MVEAEEMEEAVDDEVGDFLFKGALMDRGLTGGRFEGEDDIAEDLVRADRLPLPHREGEDVGGRIDAAVAGVKGADPLVPEEEEAQFRVGQLQLGEEGAADLAQPSPGEGDGPLPVGDGDAHASSSLPRFPLPLRS